MLSWTTQYEFAQAIQFCLFAIVVPYLLVAGGPWRWLGLTSNEPFDVNDDGSLVAPRRQLAADRWAQAKARRDGHARSIALLALFVFRLILSEEAFLAAKLGEPYQNYLRSVPRLIPMLRTRVPAARQRPQWGRALLAECFPVGSLVSFAALSWQYNAYLLERAMLVCFGISLVARALIAPKAEPAQPAA